MDYVADGLRTMHLAGDDAVFIELEPGLEYRLLQVRPDDGVVSALLRGKPGATSSLHRHTKPVFGYTVKGSWGHDASCEYRAGSYIFETPGVDHRYVNGPEETEALFISFGDVEVLDEGSREVVGLVTSDLMVSTYYGRCEELGIPRPSFLA